MKIKEKFYKTVTHFFPDFNKWIKWIIKDPRHSSYTKYGIKTLFWSGLYLFLLKLGSRRQINFKFNTEKFIRNISIICEEKLDRSPNDKTLADLLKKIPVKDFFNIKKKMIKHLIRKKRLEKYRLNGYYLIAIDGSGFLIFKEKKGNCVTRLINGVLYYWLPVLELKLVTSSGLALSVGTEFIENPGEKYDKQDCELKAFYRYADKLKKDFPQMRICLLLDGLFANQKVINICEKNHWKYIITLKEGSIPTIYKEYEVLKKLSLENRKEYEDEKIQQVFRWVNEIDYEGHLLNVLECNEYNKKKKIKTTFKWITNFKIDESNCHIVANKGGRLRWKIENEGFNMQKNGGYNMEHIFSEDIVAAKNFYSLLQISHNINQLMEKGLINASDMKRIGSIKNIAFLLLEELRNSVFDLEEIEFLKTHKFQIRLDSS